MRFESESTTASATVSVRTNERTNRIGMNHGRIEFDAKNNHTGLSSSRARFGVACLNSEEVMQKNKCLNLKFDEDQKNNANGSTDNSNESLSEEEYK